MSKSSINSFRRFSMKKRLLTFLLVAVVLSLLSSVTVSAVEPRYAFTRSASSILTINSGTANCKSKISCYSSVTHIDATQYLEKWDGSKWTTSEDFTATSSTDSSSLVFSQSYSGIGSGKYRVRTVFTVYSGANYETVEAISVEV